LLATISPTIVPTANQSARAQTPPPLPFQYVVKFICGTSPAGRFQVLARGRYFTSINLHNPLVETVRFRKKIALATPGEELFVTPAAAARRSDGLQLRRHLRGVGN
jgi:hypothetical protein